MSFQRWDYAVGYAHAHAVQSGYRYSVRADRARPGLWLVARIPGSKVWS